MLVLDVTLSEHEFSVGHEMKLEESVASLSLAFEDIPALHLADDQGLLDLIVGIDEVVILEE